MSTNPKNIDQIKAVMAEALLELRELIDDDVDHGFVQVVCLFLHGIISTAADLAELSSPGAKHYIFTDIEAGTKLGGLRAIHELGVGYSVSNIKPDDMEAAMNYLGKAMSTALFKGLYELPKPLQQNKEILLRAIEALLANLLNQRFSDSDNPHDILDSFCEHVHMELDGLQNSVKVH